MPVSLNRERAFSFLTVLNEWPDAHPEIMNLQPRAQSFIVVHIPPEMVTNTFVDEIAKRKKLIMLKVLLRYKDVWGVHHDDDKFSLIYDPDYRAIFTASSNTIAKFIEQEKAAHKH